MNIAIIPARIGSKRIKKKNIKKFNKFPIIYYSIKAALNSKLFDDVIVSTDSKEIAKVAISLGANVPFLRTKNLSSDNVPIIDVISDTIDNYIKKYDKKISFACCILPTAPMIQVSDIKLGLKKILTKKYTYVFSASQFEYSLQRAFVLGNKDYIKKYSPIYIKKRSQDLSNVYFDAGMFYWASAETWLKKKIIFSKKTSIIKIPRWRVQDIDNIDDWKRSEIMYSIIKKKLFNF